MRVTTLLSIVLLLFSCKKEEGIGGKTTLYGRVYAINMNNAFTDVLSEYYSAKEDVYIVYGDDDFYSDKVETHHDGSFRFKNLNPGTYTVYVYSKDSTEQKDIIPIEQTIEISKNTSSFTTDDFVIIK